VLADLVEISAAIEGTHDEIAATEKATSEILISAEKVLEVGWILREKGIDPTLCDTLDRHATNIYAACSSQDLTGQRTEKVMKALRFIEQRITAMVDIWGPDGTQIEPLRGVSPAHNESHKEAPSDGSGQLHGDAETKPEISAEAGIKPAPSANSGTPQECRADQAAGGKPMSASVTEYPTLEKLAAMIG
jgi:hypothetical protein